jgi:acetolactate synthase-1/2/3 large subunit
MTSLRGADIVARSLAQLGCKTVFTLSGNHIMSIFDAAIEAELDLVHVRHEAAAVHMADAMGRLTGEPGIALVTGGPGHANAVGALFTARAAESPLVLLSGHAATWELGRGGFQELRQAEMAAPVAKASWTAKSAPGLAADVAEALRIAAAGRPGPVHLSLPSDLLEQRVEADTVSWPEAEGHGSLGMALSEPDAAGVLAAIAAAEHPLILAGPALSHAGGRALLSRLEQAVRVPCVILESPRGMADATLGAFQDLARRADLVVLLGKAIDFTTSWVGGRFFDAMARVIAIDPEKEIIDRAAKEKGDKLILGRVAKTRAAAETLIAQAASARTRDGAWLTEARRAIDSRPEAWAKLTGADGILHPAQVFRALRPFIERDPGTVLICDGGEFSQWGQSLLPVGRRLTNGVAGAIGCSLPFALTARMVEKQAPVFAVLGDGTLGFHLAEFETAARRNLPFVALIGNDARWNAESQIQLREYGKNRMHGCELLPARYDLAVAALGGHGEYVDSVNALPGAIERALASGKPACINIRTESVAAPVIRLKEETSP